MKKLLLLVTLFFPFLVTNAQQYYVGAPVNEKLSTWNVVDANGCYPQYAAEVYVGPFAYVTGVKLAFKITSLNATAGSVTTSPAKTIKVGDTLLLPSGSAKGGYQFFFASGGSASMDLISYGTPQVANEAYDCPLDQALLTIKQCQREIHIQSLGGGCTVMTPTSVQPVSNEKSLSIFPNPNHGTFVLEIEDGGWKLENGKIEIYNAFGECIHRQISKSTDQQIDLTPQPNGIYFISVKTETDSYTQKLILLR